MKKFIILISIVFVVSGTWQTLQSAFYYLGLRTIVDEVAFIDTLPEPKDLQLLIMDKAKENNIPIFLEMIKVDIKDTEKNTMAGSLLESQGIQQTNRLLTVDVYYQAQIFYFPKPYRLHREKVFTVQSTIPSREPPDFEK